MKSVIRVKIGPDGKPIVDSFTWEEPRPVPPIVEGTVKKQPADTARERQKQRDEEKN